MSPKISIIIPCYNVEKYITECLDSVCGQTLKDIEVICVDDISTDNTVKLIQAYAKKDKRVKLIKSKTKSYAATARNNGMDVATGEFIAFMDSDDFYPDANVLSDLYETAKRENVKICGGGLVYFKDGEMVAAEDLYSFKEDKKIQYMDYQYDYGFTRFIYDRKFLKSNKIKFPNYIVQEDPVFYVKANMAAKEFFAMARNVYCYRITEHDHFCSIEQVKDSFTSMLWMVNFCKEHGLDKLLVNVCTRLGTPWFAEKTKMLMDKKGKIDKVVSDLFGSFDYKLIYAAQPDFELPEAFYKIIPELAKISVIIPVYKVEKYLKKCVDSVIAQTYKNLEIILVDDGSPDSCPQICEDLAKKDKRVRVVHKKNGGLSSARNAGLDVATGQYIYFLDSDDYIEPDALDTMLKTMQDNKVDIVIAWLKPFYEGKEKPLAFDGMIKYFDINNIDKSKIETKLSSNDILTFPTVAWGKLYKTSIISKYNLRFDEGLINEDEGFRWYYNTKINAGMFIPNEFYNYLIRPDSIMGDKQSKGDKIGDVLHIIDNVHEHLIRHDLLSKYDHDFHLWVNDTIAGVRYFAQEFKNEKVLRACNRSYKKYNKVSFKERLTENGHYKWPELIFSVKHSRDYTHKVVCVFGIKIKFRLKEQA